MPVKAAVIGSGNIGTDLMIKILRHGQALTMIALVKDRHQDPAIGLLSGRIDPQVVSAVTAWCAQQGVLAEELHVGRRSLEDVFLELTGRELR